MGFIRALSEGVKTFRKEYFNTEPDPQGQDLFGQLSARRLRYDLFGAAWANTAYDGSARHRNGRRPRPQMHRWSGKFKADHGLYDFTEGVFNTAHRLGELYATSLIGGKVDPEMGDGVRVPSALPILDASDPLRRAFAHVLACSNFESQKVIWTRNGAVLGDSPMMIVDDTETGRVYLKPIHPRTLAQAPQDDFGNLKGYTIDDWRDDPRQPPPTLDQLDMLRRRVRYTETAERTGAGTVLYRTYLDGIPWDWTGNGTEWEVPYDFIPLVLVKHIDVGHDFGVSEYNGALRKGMIADDLGSKLGDHIRILVDPKWFVSGVSQADLDAQVAKQKAAAASGSPQAEREQIITFCAREPQARASAMVADVKVAEISAHIISIVNGHIDDYPELRFDQIRSRADASAEAIREGRKPAEAKMQDRRAPYFHALKHALQMAATIGGIRNAEGRPGYEAFAGFGAESYHKGDMKFRWGESSVFAIDPMERLQEELAEAQAVGGWRTAGVPLRFALRRAGWDEKDIAEIEAEAEAEAKAQADPNANVDPNKAPSEKTDATG